MKNFNFDSFFDFKEAIENGKAELSKTVFYSIQESFNNNLKTSKLFTIGIEEDGLEYEIALPRSQWANALKGCLRDFEAFEESDLAIDSYLLRKKLLED